MCADSAPNDGRWREAGFPYVEDNIRTSDILWLEGSADQDACIFVFSGFLSSQDLKEIKQPEQKRGWMPFLATRMRLQEFIN